MRFIGQASVSDTLAKDNKYNYSILVFSNILNLYNQDNFRTHIYQTTYLILYRTSPSGNIRMYTLGTRMLWKRPSFSFLKKVSGIQTFFASVIVRYLIRSEKKMCAFDNWLQANGWWWKKKNGIKDKWCGNKQIINSPEPPKMH